MYVLAGGWTTGKALILVQEARCLPLRSTTFYKLHRLHDGNDRRAQDIRCDNRRKRNSRLCPRCSTDRGSNPVRPQARGGANANDDPLVYTPGLFVGLHGDPERDW